MHIDNDFCRRLHMRSQNIPLNLFLFCVLSPRAQSQSSRSVLSEEGFKWSLTLEGHSADVLQWTCSTRGPPERPLKSDVTNETREIMAVQRWSTVKRISDHPTIKMKRCRGDNHFSLGCVAWVKVLLRKYHLPLICICECLSIKTCACAAHC